MTNADEPIFSALMCDLAEAHPGTNLTQRTIRLYFEGLEHLPLEVVRTACVRGMRECRFFPKIDELRELSGVGGTPSIGLVNKLIVAQLSQPRGDWMQPKDPFLREVFERLGGPRVVGGMEDKMRLQQLPKIVPGVIEWCRLRGHAVPTEATVGSLPAITRRTPGAGAIEPKAPEVALEDLKQAGSELAAKRKRHGDDWGWDA